jgi:hypothetical protein
MAILEIDKDRKDYLWKDYGTFYLQVMREVTGSYSSRRTMVNFMRFNMTEKKILDNLIIKCFPQTYMDYLQSITP